MTGKKLNTSNLSSLSSISALPEVTAGEMAFQKSRYTDSDNNIAIIPSGATVSDVAGEQNINTGLVIKDSNGNEFVWIPVDIDQKISLRVKSKENITGITLLDPIGNEINVGSYSEKEYPRTDLTPTINGQYEVTVTAGETVKAKNLVVRSLYAMDAFNDWYSKEEVISSLAAEFSMEKDDFMALGGATDNVDFGRKYSSMYIGTETEDYSTYVNSNGGFYVGRYEAGRVSTYTVSMTNREVFSSISKSQAKTKADGMISGSTHLMTSSAWDRTLGFIMNTNSKTLTEVMGDSKTWGNYSDSTITGTGSLANTAAFGNSTKANNIYDLAGNIAEWTSTTGSNPGTPDIIRRRFR